MIAPAKTTSPARIFETLNAYQSSVALKAAIELELFTAIADGAATVPEIAQRCAASEKGIRVLADYVTIMGFLTKEDSRYSLTGESELFLSKHSPAYLGTVTGFLLTQEHLDRFQSLADTVRRGGATAEHSAVEAENPIWVDFAKCMKPMMKVPAGYMTEILGPVPEGASILDIAAGHGMFGISLAQANPGTHVTGLDWASVVEYAHANAHAAGLDGRYATISGDAFKVDFAGPYDVVLIPNFLHHFDEAANETLLKKVHGALKDGGKVAIVEFVPNDDRVSPPGQAAFSLMMLAATPSGDAYTYSQIRHMLTHAGFGLSQLHRSEEMPQSVIIAHK